MQLSLLPALFHASKQPKGLTSKEVSYIYERPPLPIAILMLCRGLAQFVREPRFGCAPVAQNRGFGDAEQFSCFERIEAAEEPALHH